MSKTVYLLSGGSDLERAAGTAGLLCELAPDSPAVRNRRGCSGPGELLGSRDLVLKSAHALVTKLLQHAPLVEGVSLLALYEENLLEHVSAALQAFNLDRWIASQGFSHCHFGSYSPWLERLKNVRTVTGSTYEIEASLPPFQSDKWGRGLQKLWNSRPTPGEVFRRIVPLWSRYGAARAYRKTAEDAPRGGIWFYSTAYTFTKIGLEYETYLPQKLNYLVEDPTTGGKRLRELGRQSHPLYGWSRPADVPTRAEVRSLAKQTTDAISAVPLSGTDHVLRELLLKSEFWELYLTRWLPFAIFNRRALQRWFESVRPEMILVGNAGYERALLLHEDVRHVPTVMLQHGVMHWVLAVMDEPVDVFLLRGPFFQRSISEELRRKTVILNFPGSAGTTAAEKPLGRTCILFITAPMEITELYHHEGKRDILRSLIRVAHDRRRPLIIRVHPMEKISSYQRMAAELQQELGVHVDVSYSQGPGAEEILSRSCVAALYASTMFLDCLRHGIPIVSFGWHWFANQKQYESEEIFNSARDLVHLEALLKKGVDGDLPVRRSGLEQFLAHTRPDEIANFFREVWDSRKSASVRANHSVA